MNTRPESSRQLLAIVMANGLEFFDFTVYTYFAVMIGRAFFPSYAPSSQLMLALGVFGLGFFARPLGALLIGAYADRAGRRAAMTLALKLMFTGTAILACTPSSAVIGAAAPALVLVARLLQGLSMGGEVGPSIACLLESAQARRRGLTTSLLLVTQGGAAAVAGSLGYLLSAMLSPDQLQAWGWRLPFVLGLLVYPAGIHLRNTLSETLPAREALPNARAIFKRIKVAHLGDLVAAIGVMTGPTVTASIVGHYMTTYGIHILVMPTPTAMLAGVAGGVAAMAAALAAGCLYDRHPRVWLAVLPQLLLTVAVYPVFLWVTQSGSTRVWLAAIVLLTALRVSGTPLHLVLIPSIFPPAVRATSLSICYALSTSVFGGSSQSMVTWLLGATGNAMTPAYYLFAANLVSWIAIAALLASRCRADWAGGRG
jgi:MFS family permease